MIRGRFIRRELGKVDTRLLRAQAVYGYFAGGSTGSSVTTTDRVTFSTGAIAAQGAGYVLTEGRYCLAGLSDGTVYGYFAGGYATDVDVTTTDRVTFSTGAIATQGAGYILTQARYGLAGLSDGAVYGYFAGGLTDDSVTTTDRVTFSTGAIAAQGAGNVLTQARRFLAGLSDGTVYGYFAGGGITGSDVDTTDRITFSTGAIAAQGAGYILTQARRGLAGLSDGAVYGYFAGGYATDVDVTTTDRVTFSTGAIATQGAGYILTQARRGLAGISDGTIYGYFAGGSNPSYVTTTDRVTFSTGAIAAQGAGYVLTEARHYFAGLSDGAV